MQLENAINYWLEVCFCLYVCYSQQTPFVGNGFTHLFLLLFFILRAQKHKERDRHKPKHKKSMDMSPSLVLPNIMVPEKVKAPIFFKDMPILFYSVFHHTQVVFSKIRGHLIIRTTSLKFRVSDSIWVHNSVRLPRQLTSSDTCATPFISHLVCFLCH